MYSSEIVKLLDLSCGKHKGHLKSSLSQFVCLFVFCTMDLLDSSTNFDVSKHGKTGRG